MMQPPHIPQPAEPRPGTPSPGPPTGDTLGEVRQHDEHLAALAAAVVAIAPLRARVVAAGVARPAMLRVVNPDAADLAEDISCGPDDGRLQFYWSWAEPICAVTDIDVAARAIARVLRGAPGHG